MLRQFYCVLAFSALAASHGSGQATLLDTLSADDREVLRLLLDSSVEEARWSADSTVLLDTTPSMCNASDRRGCVDLRHLDSLANPRLPSFIPECSRVDHSALRDAFVDRNARMWLLGALHTRLAIVSRREVWTTSTEALLKRFPGDRFVDVNAPAYSKDGQFALVYVRGFSLASPGGGWARIQVFEHRDTGWTPIDCGFQIIA